MNRKQINATLYEENNVDYLSFEISDECKISVNLNSSDSQKELKKVFSNLLAVLIENDIEIVFKKEEDYSRRMYIDVCAEYIKDLNRELHGVGQQMRKELNIQRETENTNSTFVKKVHCE